MRHALAALTSVAGVSVRLVLAGGRADQARPGRVAPPLPPGGWPGPWILRGQPPGGALS